MVVARRAAPARGFTLAELLVAVAIVAVLAGMAAPSMRQFINGQRIKTGASDLFSALVRARSEAVKRNTEITLTPVTSTLWQYGWSIPDPTNSALTIEVHGAISNAVMSGPASVVFLPNGRVKGASTPSFDISISGETAHRCVSVDLSGRPVQKTSAC